MRPFMDRGVIKIILVMAAASLFTWFLWGENLNARWGIIDDHEIALFLGPDAKVQVSRIGSLLMSTEVGELCRSNRYRPSYYFLRIMESLFWGLNPHIWYASRLVMFALSAGLLMWMVSCSVGIIPSALFTLLVFSGAYWSDIWAHLGPAETYAVVGVALYSIGFMRAYVGANDQGTRVPLSDWLLMLAGGLIAIGSKENFVLLLLPVIFLLAHLKRKQQVDVAGWVTSGILALYGLLVTTSVGIALARLKVNVYGDSVSLDSRLALVRQPIIVFASDPRVISCLLLTSVVAIILLYQNKKNGDVTAELLKKMSRFFAVAVILLGLYVSQYVFYAGRWPCSTRYDFPGVLACPLLLLATVVFIRKMFEITKQSRFLHNCLLAIFSIVLMVSINWQGFSALRAASVANVIATQAFSQKMDTLVHLLKSQPESGLVIESFHVRDYEPVGSIGRFLRAYGVKNPLFLHINDHPRFARAPFELTLAESMDKASMNGSSGVYLSRSEKFSPLSDVSKVKDCYSISLSEVDSSRSACNYLGQIY
jgi:hypothetical protein